VDCGPRARIDVASKMNQCRHSIRLNHLRIRAARAFAVIARQAGSAAAAASIARRVSAAPWSGATIVELPDQGAAVRRSSRRSPDC